jgi:carbamoyltransferase
VANARLLKAGVYDEMWVQPAAGDAGGALGAALSAYHTYYGNKREASGTDKMQGSYLGPEYSALDIEMTARKYGARYTRHSHFGEVCDTVAGLLSEGNVVGWFQGRMEWGPRALGNRSILGDARNEEMQKRLNVKIKFRESFRPFAPSVLYEDAREYFDMDTPSPYMLLVADVQEQRRNALPQDYHKLSVKEKLYHVRSDIPAVTHLDYSARVQTVHGETNERYARLIKAFKQRTGYGLVVNTSFNVRGEPIVCSPEDAYRCFMRTDMDYLVLGNYIFKKSEQPQWSEERDWKKEFVLD